MKKVTNLLLILFGMTCVLGACPAWADDSHSIINCRDKEAWEYKGVHSVEGLAHIKHYKWERAVPPFGPMDKIALHRLVNEPLNAVMLPDRPAHDKRKVIFLLPGIWGQAYSPNNNPDQNLGLFLAINGYDVYGMDYRTKYIPNPAYHQFESLGIDISTTGSWTLGVFREDIKACVEKTKKISRAHKIFLGGLSLGVTQMWIYASKYLGDVKGLICMDGRGIKAAPTENTVFLADMTPEEIEAATAAYAAAVSDFQTNGVLLYEQYGYEQALFGSLVPYAESAVGFNSFEEYVVDFKAHAYPPPPDPFMPITNSIELSAYFSYWRWGPGIISNIYIPYPGGNGETYMDPEVLNETRGNNTRYWPDIHTQEISATFGGGGLDRYDDCPFLDYDDHWQEIDVPVISFNGESTCTGGCAGTNIEYTLNNLATDDATLIYLAGYGHLDVFSGTHSREDMKEPLLKWLNERK